MGAPRNLTDGTLTVKDGTGTPKQLAVVMDSGELDFEIMEPTKAPVHNRKEIVSVREGRKQLHPVTFKCGFDFLQGDTAGSTPSLHEALKGYGLATSSGWVTVGTAASGSSYCTNIIFEIVSPAGVATEKAETVTIGKFHLTSFKVVEGESQNNVEVKGLAETITSARHS